MAIQEQLEGLYKKWNRPEFRGTDPIALVHRYSDSQNQEVVGLIAALLAYGRVSQILKNAEQLIQILTDWEGAPAKAVFRIQQSPHQALLLAQELVAWKHRFQVGQDLAALMDLVAYSWNEAGTLGRFFGERRTSDRLLTGGIQEWWSYLERRPWKRTQGLVHLITSEDSHGVNKRWNMYLRWMVRKDEIDLGLWQEQGWHPRELKMPLDTHTARICQYLGLRTRKTMDERTVDEVTGNLRKISREDPVRYDFALARLGILDLCKKREVASICSACDLALVCRYRKATL